MIRPPVVNSWQFEVMKAGLSAAVTCTGLLLTWFIGQRLTSRWSVWQKQREIEMATATTFYELYGEFISAWRFWRATVQYSNPTRREAVRWELLERCTTAEGRLEAIFVKISAERLLRPEEVTTLGMFRQAYRTVRYRIRADQSVAWTSHDPEYLLVKKLAAEVATLIRSGSSGPRPSAHEAANSLMEITSVRFRHWRDSVAAEEGRRPEAAHSIRLSAGSVIETGTRVREPT